MHQKRELREIVFAFSSENRLLFLIAFLSESISSIFNVLIPLSIGKYFELNFNHVNSKSQFFQFLPFEPNTIHEFFIFFGVLIFGKGVAVFGSRYSSGLLGERLTLFLRNTLFRNQMRLNIESFRSKIISDHLLPFSHDMNALQRYLLKGIIQFSADIVFLILCLLVLFAFSIALGTIVFFSFLLLTIAMRIAANASKAHLEQKRKAKAGLFHFVSRRLSQYYSLLTFNMNEREIKKFEERNLKYYKFTEPYFRLSALYQALVPVSYFLIFMVVLMYTSIAEVKEAYQREGYASILSFMLILLYSQSVMKRIQRINPIWHQGKMAIARFKSIPDTRNEITENVEQKLSSIELKVENLALPLLANQKLNFVCQPNTLSQLLYGDARVLRNFINVLLRTEDALSGKIRLNDMDADAMSSLNWRRNIGLGDSDIPFTGKDYFHSISYSSSDKKKKKASELIQTLIPGVNEEDFLNSKITHDGQDLSQEVKSQLAFLRAWMTEKKLIMLVEPFKGLTHEQLSLFIEFIEQKRKSYTILIACNELPFALKADQIISL